MRYMEVKDKGRYTTAGVYSINSRVGVGNDRRCNYK